jgi:hypothetical protein
VIDMAVVRCAGWPLGARCRAVAPAAKLTPSAFEARGGRPWMCVRCARKRFGEMRRGAGHPSASRTTCLYGHPLDGVMQTSRGLRRYCPTCRRERNRRVPRVRAPFVAKPATAARRCA